MRVYAQIAVGYSVAAIAVIAATALTFSQVASVGADVEEITEEWRELEAVSAAISALRHDGTKAGVEEALRAAERLHAMAGDLEAHGERTETRHERKERELLGSLAERLRSTVHAPPESRKAAEAEAIDAAVAFWNEDRGRVARRIEDIERHRARLRPLVLVTGLGLVMLPIALFVWQLRRILRPLSSILRRVEAIGGPAAPPGSAGTRVDRLSAAVDEMAQAVEARRRTLEDQVATRTDQLRHADRLGGLGRIAAAVAHEINNPLGSIGLCVDAIGRQLDRDRLRIGEVRSYVETMAAEVERCKATTRKLLSYAHYRPGEHVAIPAGSLANSALDLVRAFARREGVLLNLSEASASVRGDPEQLRQVLVNLLLNAIHASDRGGKVDLSVDVDGEQVVFRVLDHGSGIPKADREHVFHPFFTTRRPGEGTGLGLSIAREIVEGHGGTIVLERAPGTSFAVRLPKVDPK